MDLELVGRHTLFFDDDAMAAFVNSSNALVDWNSLQIDRYDVRHLLSAPLPPRRRRNPQTSSQLPDFAFECELDQERYLDLPPPSDEAGDEAEKPGDNSGYNAVGFSYGNAESTDQKNADGVLESFEFSPPFAVPDCLLQSLPPTEKVHQIIARTATFVSKHGGQSEIVLRVKQGDNPSFGFLMPDHHLHPYFRFLVDHQELLQSDIDGKTQPDDQMANANQNSAVGGALSLLGSVYGSGEDEDSAMEGGHDVINITSENTVNTSSKRDSHGLQKTDFSSNEAQKDEDCIMAKHQPSSNKDKAPVLKKNPSLAASKAGITSSMKYKDGSASFPHPVEKSKEPLILEPPSDMKRLIDKIVEFIIKNGKQFEATLREQDSKHRRFPFLLPSNQYHPYYLKVLQKAEESKVGARNSFHGRDDLTGRILDKRALVSEDNDASFLGSVGSDLPFESDRKEKFKMVIGKGKKDMQDPASKATQQEYGIAVDLEATAAILQAATRGIRNPNLGVISTNAINSSTHGLGSEVGQGSNFRNQASSQLNDVIQMSDQDGGCNSSVPDAQTAQGAVAETAGEAHLTREQKLKAERLKRAKMFVAMLKSGAGPSTAEQSRALSAEPAESGALVTGAEVNLVDKAKAGSSVPVDSCIPDESENTGRRHFGHEYSERRLRRKYRLRSERHVMDDQNDDEEDEEEDHSRKKHQSHGSSREGNGGREKDEEEREHKHSKRKHRSHHSSYEEDNNNEDRKEKSHKQSRKKHQSRHSSHEDDDEEKDIRTSYHKHSSKKRLSQRSFHEGDDEGEYEDEKYHKHSRKKHRSHRDSHKNKKRSHRRSKHDSSSDAQHGDRTRHVEHLGKEDLEEGEISSKGLDQSRRSVAEGGSRETSMDITRPRAPSQPSETTQVPDDLRAKIRAMLMATR